MIIKCEQLVLRKDWEDDDYVFVEAIKSRLSPGKRKLLKLLDQFEAGKIGNCYMADSCDELWDNLEEQCRLVLGLKEKKVQILMTPYYLFEKENISPVAYPNTIDWAVSSCLRLASTFHILLSDVPFIREFLNCPPGQEEEALKKWHDYWSKVDFAERFGIAPM